MRKADLVNQVSAKTGISQIDTLVTLEQTLSTIQDMLAAGESLFIRGFGTFAPKKRAAKKGRNIKKGEPVHIPEHHIPHFKPSPEFKHMLRRPAGGVRHESTFNQ